MINRLKTTLRLIKNRKKNPTSILYSGSFLDSSSKLEKYNVLFPNVKVINSTIGSHSFIQKNTVVINSSIGRFCSIADNIHIGLGQHPIDQVSSHPAFYSVNQPIAKTFSDKNSYTPFKPISIGNDVWIGSNAIVMDGVIIGNGAVIAAGAVVTKNVESYSVVGGIPAKHIKFRFDRELRERLIRSKWWEKDEDWLKENAQFFDDPETFLNRNIEDKDNE